MDELLTFFSESNITLSQEQKIHFVRLTGNLRNAVTVNNEKSDELIMRLREHEELTTFVSSIFLSNKKVMSQFVWRTIVTGIIGGARKMREY